jgi:hypothetical protein
MVNLSNLTVRVLRPDERPRCQALLTEHHYLGAAALAGDQLWQVAEHDGAWVALIAWGACAKALKAREAYIGWDARTRQERSKLVVNQARFCVLVHQTNLASRVLALSLKVLPAQWEQAHGYQPLLAESFVDPERFAGTCYKAAGWEAVGLSEGHRRHGDYYVPDSTPKQLLLKPLHPQACALLRGPKEHLPKACQASAPLACMGAAPLNLKQMDSLMEAFRKVPDPRRGNRTHRLHCVLAIYAMGLLMGYSRPADMLRLAQQLNPKQREALGYHRPRGSKVYLAPGRDVMYTLLGRVDPKVFAEVLTDWLKQHQGKLPRALAIDGKTVKDRLAQVVSIVEHESGATVAVAPILTADKEHEVPTARALLGSMDLEGAVVSLDAGHSNSATAHTIVQQGGDYLMQLKGNTPVMQAVAQSKVAGKEPLFST